MQGSRKLPASTKTPRDAPVDASRSKRDPITALIDHCQAAKTIADEEGQKFLSHLLAMTLLAAHELQHAPRIP